MVPQPEAVGRDITDDETYLCMDSGKGVPVARFMRDGYEAETNNKPTYAFHRIRGIIELKGNSKLAFRR
jgi:hypothetical protein